MFRPYMLHTGELEQTRDIALLIDVDPYGRGDLGQSGHGHHVARDGHDEPGAVGYAHFTDLDNMIGRRAAHGRVRGE